MRRPAQRPPTPALTEYDRCQLANRAKYTGSPEHKEGRWWGGLSEGRQLPGGEVGRRGKRQTTICPLTTPEGQRRATRWVQEAIASGQCRFFEGDRDFPKKVWHQDEDGQFWLGVCSNKEAGHYKGWPITEQERDEVFG